MTGKADMLWLNGQLVPAAEAHWPIADRGLGLGDGLFETVRLTTGQPRHFADHWQRLRNSAKTLGFGDIGSGNIALDAIRQLSDKTKIRNGSVRILLSRGQGPRGLDIPKDSACNWLIRIFEKADTHARLVTLALSQIRRNAANPVSLHKTISHLDMVMSRKLLVGGAKGNESLLLDHRARLCCAGTGNLFWLYGERLFTPSAACGILPGTTRARLLELAPKLGLQVATGSYWPRSIAKADAVFICNALIGVRPVIRIDLGQGQVFEFVKEHPTICKLAASEV